MSETKVERRLTRLEDRAETAEEILKRLDIAILGDNENLDDFGMVGRVKANSDYRVRLQSIHSKVIKYTLGLIPLTITGYFTYLKAKHFGGE